MRSWRFVLLLVLTVLLPLRSAMALTMGLPNAGTMPGTTAIASVEEAPCPHHAAPESPLLSTDSSAHGSHHGQSPSHLLCDLCNVPALGQTAELATGTSLQPFGVAPRSERFVSVVLPIGHKPPIPA